MAEEINRRLMIGPIASGESLEADITFRSVVPELAPQMPADLSYDFSAAIAEVLGLPEEHWRIKGLEISKTVPWRILQEFYDAALLYGAIQRRQLPDVFDALVGERILVKCLSGMPELLVKYRYYLGLAGDDGEYKIVSDHGDDLQLIGILDPYDRLFWLPVPSTRKLIRDKYGEVSIFVKGRNDLQVYQGGLILPVLRFRWCLERLIPDSQNPVRRFLTDVYTNVRIPEYHACRLGDNALFQLDRLVPGVIRAMNFLFSEDLAMPWSRSLRQPFAPRLFRLAGTRPLPDGRMRVQLEDAILPVESSKRFY